MDITAEQMTAIVLLINALTADAVLLIHAWRMSGVIRATKVQVPPAEPAIPEKS